MHRKKLIINLIICAVAAALAIAFFLIGEKAGINSRVNDALYQTGDLRSGDICILQIDEHSLDELGPYNTWTRDYVAEAIERLNADPDTAPAVIGVDILYIGNTSEESDAHLVNAASTEDNVVFGSFVNMDMELTEEDGAYAMEQAVTLYEEPFEELKAESTVGFVNGFMDTDGVIRHSLKDMELEDGSVIPSFSYEVYRRYAERGGTDADGKPLDPDPDIPLNPDGFWYVDFTGRPGDYSDGFSISDFLQGEIPAEYFADKIVLIGPYAEAMMDGYATAVDRSDSMYGVEVHANLIESMLRGTYKREITTGIMTALIVLVTVLCVLACFPGKLRYSFICSGVFIVLFPLACLGLYKAGIVIPVIYIPVTAAVVMVVNIVIHYIRAAAEKKKVETTFRRYVAPEVVDEITRTGMDTIKLGGQAVDCAILFVDIRGFTTMSEALEPEQVVSILNRYLELTSTSIFKFGGTLDKFIGDATMAIFGAPLPEEDYIFKAVCAAWDMVECAQALAETLQKEFGRSVSFGVGVHCGRAVVGNIGTARRMDYTAIGDTVNTSARLEANAPRDTVYISEDVVAALGDRITCESVGCIPLKGKSREMEVFRLTGIVG